MVNKPLEARFWGYVGGGWLISHILYIHRLIGSMYGIFTYIWLIFMVNVGEYAILGSYGINILTHLGLPRCPRNAER